jgi:hypothetical protein
MAGSIVPRECSGFGVDVLNMSRLPKAQARRPMHTILRLLPQVEMDEDGGIDSHRTEAKILRELSDYAFDCAGALHRGVSAIGSLMAYAAPEIEDGTISSDSIEALAWLLAEIGDLGSGCFNIAAQCKRAAAANSELLPP